MHITFDGYDKSNFTNISESFTVTAKWTINQYTLTIVYGNGQENKIITQDYNTPIESIANPESRAGYGFIWDKTIPTNMPAENLTVTAKWNAIFTLSEGTVTGLTDYGKKNYTELYIPSIIDGVTITTIGSSAFSGCSSLMSVTIPDSVKRIGDSAFSGCSSLESITIPFVGAVAGKTASDTYQYPFGYIFGTSSYTGGTATWQYYYGSSTSSSTDTRYYIPSSLRKVTVTGGNILRGAFWGCSNLTSMMIGNSVTSINSSAFSGCSSLTSVTIGDGETSIGDGVFSSCGSITSFTVAEGNPSYQSINGNLYTKDGTTLIQYAIGKSATTFAIPNGVTSIGYAAFQGCSKLTSVTIGNSVTSIGSRAFCGCSSLTSVTIGNSVTSIGERAFV